MLRRISVDFRRELRLFDELEVRVWPVLIASDSTFVLLADMQLVAFGTRPTSVTTLPQRVSAAHAVITCVKRGQGKVPLAGPIADLLRDGAEQCAELTDEVMAESCPEMARALESGEQQ